MRLTGPNPVTYQSQTGNVLYFQGPDRQRFSLSVLEHDIIRVGHHPDGTPRLDRTWLIVDETGTTPRAGRRRDDLSPFSLPDFEQETTASHIRLATDALQIEVALDDFSLRWLRPDGQEFAADTVHRAYPYDKGGRAVFHYQQHRPDEHYYGFGEKSGPLDKRQRRLVMRNVDALGYDAEHTDPLYKHVPFYITFIPGLNVAYGLLYDNLATTTFDMGREIDAYHGFYRYYQADDGDIDYYLIYGPSIPEVVAKLARLTGYMTLPPRWALGYLGSTMTYTEQADAQTALQQFVVLCAQHDIPCDLFHLSSGYTTGPDGNRYVFNWHPDKIPDPAGMVAGFHAGDIKLAANVKPYLLATHPRYEEVRAFNGFIQQYEDDEPEPAHLWSGGIGESASGAYLDFTNPATYQWWQANLRQQLLAHGIDSIWNDNNEYEIWDDAARCQGFGDELPVGLLRPIQTLLMNRASYEAQQANRPDERPFVLTRAGCPGIQRYAQTWSGDNRTAWETLRYNIPLGLGMSLSGIPNIGHDVGGFFGPKPSPELFVRWVQNGVFHPRFTIHSFNSDGSVNEPWMYPDVLPLVRDAIRLRYALLPYLYTLFFQAARTGAPIIRPLVYHFPDDSRCYTESFQFMLGPSLLVATVLEPEVTSWPVYLPAGTDWIDYWSGMLHTGGQTVRLPVTLDSIPLFVPVGGIIPLGKAQKFPDRAADDWRLVRLFPAQDGTLHRFTLIEDDGLSLAYQQGRYTSIQLEMTGQAEAVQLAVTVEGDYPLPYEALAVQLPSGDARPLHIIDPRGGVSEAASIGENTYRLPL